ncbi:MAG: gamma-glutamyltransferase [Planctomycetota bacterium]|jgi:gamma-glutamyltranspeptidase/glutathione hydrolase
MAPVVVLLLLVCLTAPGVDARAGDVVYERAAVAADHVVASRAGLEMLKRGGNAVDAAVAASFCLSVVRPYSCGIGGGGFMLIYRPGDGGAGPLAVAIDYRETAPAAVGPAYFVGLADGAASRAGHSASGVPGTVAGLLWALEHFGTLDRGTVLAPAIRAAEQGVAVDASHVEAAGRLAQRLAEAPHLRPAAASLWGQLCLAGEIEVGDPVRNPGQARALRLIAEHGRDGFYRGPVARAITECMAANEGTITAADLAAYHVRVTEPLRGGFRGLEVLSMPPPSSGGLALLQVLGIVERRLDDIALDHNRPSYVHLLAEAMKHAFADRAAWLADPDFVDVPVRRLLSATYLDGRAASIDPGRTHEPRHYGSTAAVVEDGGTSHLSVIDGAGMAVACTETINLVYGSLVAVPGFGFALNDQMDDFTTRPGQPNAFGLRQSERNLPAPGKRPLSSMAPTILLAEGRPVVVAGASGGPRIITGTLQCILNCVLYDMTPRQAVAAPRFHHQWLPDVLEFEAQWTDEPTITRLEDLGHRAGRRDDVGIVQLIRAGPDGIRAASDPRKGGAPAGY